MLSWMATDYFDKSPVLIFPMIALFLFMGAFTVIVVRAMLKRRAEIERMARLPLEDDQPAAAAAAAEEDR